MRVLVVKTSSLGDVIHTLPALTDAVAARPELRFDWVVEEGFAEIPAWHPAVDRVIPVALRRWRGHLLDSATRREWKAFRRLLGQRDYAAVIDAQGLLKSAFLTRLVPPPRHGLDRQSAREPLAALAYDHPHPVPWGRHAVVRVRELFARALDYPVPEGTADYGIDRMRLGSYGMDGDYVVFLHGTTWATKHWPRRYWEELARHVTAAGLKVLLPWGNQAERERAQAIAGVCENIQVLPRMDLAHLAGAFAGARAVVAVDTGLSHLVAALDIPQVVIYGATDPKRTGSYGRGQHHLEADFDCAPCLQRRCRYGGTAQVFPACYASVQPERVWKTLQELARISRRGGG